MGWRSCADISQVGGLFDRHRRSTEFGGQALSASDWRTDYETHKAEGGITLSMAETHDKSALYLYCIGESAALSALLEKDVPPAIEPATALRLICSGELCAIVSDVPLAEYGEEEIQSRLTEPAWVASRAMRHEAVLEHFAKDSGDTGGTGLVPLRFGTIYLRPDGVEQMLAEKQAELAATLERLKNKDEWGVNVFCDRAVLTETITKLSPTLREMAERAEAASAGQAYLLRKKIEGMRTDETRVEVRRAVKEIEQELSPLSSGAVRLKVRQAEAAEHGELVAKLAFLVNRNLFEKFRDTAGEIAHQRGSFGFRLELTGPWPAYNFVDEPKS